MMKWQSGPVKNLVLVSGSAFLVLALVVIGLLIVTASPVPAAMRGQVRFTIFYPKPSKEIELDKNSFRYDEALKQLTFKVSYAGQTITFAEQTTPDQFNDIPEYFPKLLEKMNSYATFENTVGKVALTRPTETKRQAAVMASKGTLLFASAEGDLGNDQWRHVFNALIFEKGRS